jgi:hypothetical protein
MSQPGDGARPSEMLIDRFLPRSGHVLDVGGGPGGI